MENASSRRGTIYRAQTTTDGGYKGGISELAEEAPCTADRRKKKPHSSRRVNWIISFQRYGALGPRPRSTCANMSMMVNRPIQPRAAIVPVLNIFSLMSHIWRLMSGGSPADLIVAFCVTPAVKVLSPLCRNKDINTIWEITGLLWYGKSDTAKGDKAIVLRRALSQQLSI